jgi:hypothetical protein
MDLIILNLSFKNLNSITILFNNINNIFFCKKEKFRPFKISDIFIK